MLPRSNGTQHFNEYYKIFKISKQISEKHNFPEGNGVTHMVLTCISGYQRENLHFFQRELVPLESESLGGKRP